MTCIAAVYRSPTDYAIASDTESAHSQHGSRVASGPKVWAWGPILLGTCGSLAQRQHLEWGLGLDEVPTTAGELRKLLTHAYEALGSRVGSPPHGCLPNVDLEILVVSPWGILAVDQEGGIVDPGGWWAIGSGGPEARGALWAARASVGSRWCAEMAVKAAIALDSGCGGKPAVLSAPES